MSVKINMTTVLKLLPELTQGELKQVLATVKRLLKPDAPAATTSPLYSALQTVAGSKMPFSRFRHTPAYKNWGEDFVLEFIERTWGTQNRVILTALIVFLVQLEADWLKGRNIPVGINSLVGSLHHIPEIFDQAFPGYRETGLAPLVLKRMVRK